MYSRRDDVIVFRHPFALVRERMGWRTYEEAAKAIQTLVQRHCGVQLAARREKPYRWEHYRIQPELVVQLALARELGVPDDHVTSRRWPAWLPVDGDIDIDMPWNAEGAALALDEAVSKAMSDRRGFMVVTGGALVALTTDWVGLEPDRMTAALGGGQVDDAMMRGLEEDLSRLRRLDDIIGGARARGVIHAHLAMVSQLLSESRCTGACRERLLGVAAELARMAGWSACDAGMHAAAQRYWIAALRMSQEVADSAAGANILKCMALPHLDVGNTGDALTLANAAVQTCTRETSRVRAMLLTRKARVHAERGERPECERAIAKAVAVFERADSDAIPTWAEYFDHGELASQVGNCHLLLGQFDAADRWLADGITQHGDGKIRDLGTYLLWRATALVRNRDVDHAACLAIEAAPYLGQSVGSWRNQMRVRTLRAHLRPHLADGRVREAHARLAAVV